MADGVDVINFSISGSQTNFRDPVEIAFLFAADAGIFVAASAGNSGPTTSHRCAPRPVADDRRRGHAQPRRRRLGDARQWRDLRRRFGADPIGPRPLIDSTAAGLPGADPTAVALCFAAEDNGGAPVLDPAKVAGKIVVCDRGVTARINKSLAVQQAGGVGMILVNT